MRKLLAALAVASSCLVGLPASAQLAVTPTSPILLSTTQTKVPTFVALGDYEVSAANTALTFTYDLRNLHDSLAINGVCSAGTATLVVSASADGVNFFTIDSITTALTQVKQYTATTVGATAALSPLSFRFVKIAIGACGASNTDTLYVAIK